MCERGAGRGRGVRTVDGAQDVLSAGDVLAGAAVAITEGVIDALLVQEEVDDVRAAEGGGEVEGGGARASGVDRVWGNRAVGEQQRDGVGWGKGQQLRR